MERRNYLIEELIKADHTYRPPADYRPAKKHRKVSLRLPCLPHCWLITQADAQPEEPVAARNIHGSMQPDPERAGSLPGCI